MQANDNYFSGFGGYFESEALANTLPKQQNSPQQVANGLYAEQLNGSAFTCPRQTNKYSWFYRIHPSVKQGEFQPVEQSHWLSPPFNDFPTPPTQYRWDPLDIPKHACDFIQGIHTVAAHGDPAQHTGAAIHWYVANTSMTEQYFYNADGDLLIVPESGRLQINTECGVLTIDPQEIAVIPRGIKFQVVLLDDTARGYICENFGAHFILPDLGPIGANGLAYPRHFLTPTAAFEDKAGEFTLITKYQGNLWQAELNHSPLDVVAWHGNYVPYKYDLRLFNVMNTVSFDHADPSIFTVLTSPSNTPGVANIDFVIFPPRWLVAEHTFRPPYYHRNIMSEFMGLLAGVYDAKAGGFAPGGGSLHNCMSAHGPDNQSLQEALKAKLKPQQYKNTMAFMFESIFAWRPTTWALERKQQNYLACWQDIPNTFSSVS